MDIGAHGYRIKTRKDKLTLTMHSIKKEAKRAIGREEGEGGRLGRD